MGKSFSGERLSSAEAKEVGNKISSRIGETLEKAPLVTRAEWLGEHYVQVAVDNGHDFRILSQLKEELVAAFREHMEVNNVKLRVVGPQTVQKPEIKIEHFMPMEDLMEVMDHKMNITLCRCFRCKGPAPVEVSNRVIICNGCFDEIE